MHYAVHDHAKLWTTRTAMNQMLRVAGYTVIVTSVASANQCPLPSTLFHCAQLMAVASWRAHVVFCNSTVPALLSGCAHLSAASEAAKHLCVAVLRVASRTSECACMRDRAVDRWCSDHWQQTPINRAPVAVGAAIIGALSGLLIVGLHALEQEDTGKGACPPSPLLDYRQRDNDSSEWVLRYLQLLMSPYTSTSWA